MLRTFKPTDDTTVTISLRSYDKQGCRMLWLYTLNVRDKDGLRSIFHGTDLSTYYTRTEEEAMRDLICFLTTKSDEQDYNARQLDWLNSYACEALSIETE